MKKTMKYLSMAVVALMGAVMAACSADDSIVSEPQQSQGRAVTLTTTVNMGSGSTTRALTSKGVKTFAVGEQMTIWYETNTPAEWADDNFRVAVSEPLKASDISADGKSATITVTMIDPMAKGFTMWFYPAPMGGPHLKDIKDYNNNWSPLQACMAGQDGTLEYVAANVDWAYEEDIMTDDAKLPSSITLENPFAVFAVTIKNADGTQDVTSTIKDLTVTGITISRKTAGDTIYFAMPARNYVNVEYIATTFDGNTTYTKTLTNKTYEEGHFYALGLWMTPVAPASPGPDIEWTSVRYIPEPNGNNCISVYGPWVDDHFTPSAISLSGTSEGYYFMMNFGSTVTLNGLTATYDGGIDFIYASGDLNLVVNGTNSISCKNYSQSVAADGTLKLSGNGTLTVTANSSSRYGLHASSNYHNKIYDSVNQVWLDPNNSDPSVLAAYGYTVTRSDTQDNGDGTYTWTYTVAPAQ